ncbi:MAG TPA: tetratricopeptide repeat protein [Bryobacteraceae bacterium]|nr:tetratricopeptide repeat protein [Bryobacteraceae bacterium]
MDRRTRKQLKGDKFAQEVGQTFEFVTTHRTEILRYGGAALAAILIAGGIYFYHRHAVSVREEALAQALRIDDAKVSPTPQPPNVTFATDQEKEAAWTRAFSDLAKNYRGTQEGAIGGIYLGGHLAEQGKMDQAEKVLKDVADSAPKEYAALAKMSLAQIYAAQGKIQDARSLIQQVIEHPTAMVSKEEAQIQLAEILAPTDPATARKILDPLRTSRTAVSRAAITAYGNLPQN